MRPGAKTKAICAYLPDREVLPEEERVGKLVNLYDDFFSDFSREKALGMLDDLGISSAARVRELSQGMRDKLQLCLTMSRAARVYLLDEPIGGVDPAARDYILSTILLNYSPDAAVVISTHLIADIEPILDEVVLLREGHVLLHKNADDLREECGMSVDAYFRREFSG